VIDSGRDGSSQPFALARIVRVPQIDAFTVADAAPQNGTRQYQLKGQNLETIEKLGWDQDKGWEIGGLPTPLPGPGLKQSLDANLPDPPANEAALYVWLRGDPHGRAAAVKAPALPAPPPAPAPAPAVSPAQTSVTLSSSAEPSYVGQVVTLVAKVSPPEATGTVTFQQRKGALGTATLNSGQASFTTSTLPAGSLPMTVLYSGDAKFAGSTSPLLTQTVKQGTTAATISADPNPSTAGQAVTFTAIVKVTSPSPGAPAGTVNFTVGDTTLGTATLDASGTARFSTSKLTAGKYTVQAVYAGSAALEGCSSAAITQVVQ
jgi:hypothetical protein